MYIVLIRTIILYFVVLLAIRIMGKSELSKMSPFQMVIIFMIAELAAIPIESPSISLINGCIAIFSLLFLQVLISYISIKSEKFKNFISGKPSVIIENGVVNSKEMKRLRLSISDLTEQLRLGNCPCICDVNHAVLESNGSLSIVMKPDRRPVTLADMKIQPGDESMPKVIVSDGTVYVNNLIKDGFDEDYLKTCMTSCGIDNIHDVFLAISDEQNKIHIYCKDATTDMVREVTI